MKEGDTLFVALSWSEHPAPRTYEQAYERLVWTAHHWQHWLDHGEFPDHPWRTFLQRSALTLKGLSYAPTGALVAAATTSLPETPGGQRNWDYRYTWIRDATFMLWGLYTLGFDWEANDFFYFLADIAEAEQGKLQIMYGIDGESALPEQELDHLSGYDGARPVRIGNDAYRQDQHDVWGAILDSFYLHTKSRDQLPERIWPILVKQVESALASWREPDHGIWEIRGEPQHFTSSKLMCWVAADRGARLAEIRGDLEYAARWQSAADEIKADICANALDDRGVLSALREHGARCVGAADAAGALPAGARRADPENRAGHCRRAHGGRTRPALPDRGDGRRPLRTGGDVHDLLLLARLGARRDRRDGSGSRPLREAPLLCQPAPALRRGDRPR
jgi:GH15 family glucan-1,4-alpha-glucosidase